MPDYEIEMTEEEAAALEAAVRSGSVEPVSDAEWSRFVLRALLSYHERITMGGNPELDCWKQGLQFAISCVEEKIPK